MTETACESTFTRERLFAFEEHAWPAQAAGVIDLAIAAACSERGSCSLMLTGGNTAERLYRHWAAADTLPASGLQLYFGDERCVPPDHADSNYGLTARTLLAHGLPPGCAVARMEAEAPDRDAAAIRYENRLPDRIDVLLLGLGPDGHVASLFPDSPALLETGRSVVPVSGSKTPTERLTITPRVIARARSVFLLATGAEKGRVLADALRHPEDFMACPVRLVREATWLLDAGAAEQLR